MSLAWHITDTPLGRHLTLRFASAFACAPTPWDSWPLRIVAHLVANPGISLAQFRPLGADIDYNHFRSSEIDCGRLNSKYR